MRTTHNLRGAGASKRGSVVSSTANRVDGDRRFAFLAMLAMVALVVATFQILLAPTAAQAHPSSFPDVTETTTGHEAIEYLAGVGVVGGFQDGSFGPDLPLNRGQAAKMLVRQNGITTASTTTTPSFSDADTVFVAYVEAAAAEGWVIGYPDGTFRTYDPLQRQQMALIIVRSLGWEAEALALSPSEVTQKLTAFIDADAIYAGARPYVALAFDRGLFKGDAAGRFNPAESITRSQFALVAYRAEVNKLARVEGFRANADYPDKASRDRTRLVVDLSAAPGAITRTLSGSSVLVIDIAGAYVEGGGVDFPVSSEEIELTAARQLTYRPQEVRVTVTLNRLSPYKVSLIPPSGDRGYRVVIDVFKRLTGPVGDGPPLVAIDPGHGGKDPGAVGVTGVLEKNVNLSIALLVDQLLRDAGLRTLLTRADDTYPTLSERVDLANQAQANIFVSIHNNSSGDSATNGTETYYWGTADDFSPEGKALAEAIQRNLVSSLGSKDRTARTHWQSLYVLSHSDMPAALTEVGFLSNATEEAKLRDPAYLRAAAVGIVQGILEYLGWNVEALAIGAGAGSTG